MNETNLIPKSVHSLEIEKLSKCRKRKLRNMCNTDPLTLNSHEIHRDFNKCMMNYEQANK